MLYSALPEGQVFFTSLTCDRCGRSIDVSRESPTGWQIGVDAPPDLCPACASETDVLGEAADSL